MSMNLRRARQIIKQRHHTATLLLRVLDTGAVDDRSLYEVMRKRGWKEGQGILRELITALTVAGKVSTHKGVYRLATDEAPAPQRPAGGKIRDVWPAVVEPAPVNESLVWVDECTNEDKETDMDLSALTPDQMLEMAAQMQRMAEAKKRELDPELLRQLLEAGQSVLDASDLMVESIERFRKAADAVREARGLPTAKKS